MHQEADILSLIEEYINTVKSSNCRNEEELRVLQFSSLARMWVAGSAALAVLRFSLVNILCLSISREDKKQDFIKKR